MEELQEVGCEPPLFVIAYPVGESIFGGTDRFRMATLTLFRVQSGVCDEDGVRRHRRWAAQSPTDVKLRSKLARETQEVQLGLVQVLANAATRAPTSALSDLSGACPGG